MNKNSILFVSIVAFVFGSILPIAAHAATSPSLGTAATYSILAGSEVTNTGATTISGDVGISPGIGVLPHFSGFGTVTLGGTVHDADAVALTAQGDKNAAYTALATQGCDTDYGAVTKELAGETLVPGVYCATSFHLSSGTLTLSGSASDVWIFKSASDLIITGGSSAKVVFTGDGLACNVWWRVVSTATFDANSSLVGNILADTSITLAAGATLNGRALARTAAVTLSSNSIVAPTCTVPPPPPPPDCPDGNAQVTTSGINVVGGIVTGTFLIAEGCEDIRVSLASYKAPAATFALPQTLFDSSTGLFSAGGPFTLTADIPPCFYQVDLVLGDVIVNLALNNLYGPRLLQFAHGGTNSCDQEPLAPQFHTFNNGYNNHFNNGYTNGYNNNFNNGYNNGYTNGYNNNFNNGYNNGYKA